MSILARIKEQARLAEIYATDGALHSAGRVLRDLADAVDARARARDAALARSTEAAPSSDDKEERT